MLIIPISSIFYKIKICATSECQPRYLVATLPYFSRRFDISVRDFASRRKIGIESGKAKERQRGRESEREGGEGEIEGGNICTKGQSRRVADVNLLRSDEAKSRGGDRPVEEAGGSG